MRTLLFTFGAIVAVVAIGTGVGEPLEPAAPAVWVRTVDGWEPLAGLVTSPARPRTLHPLVVAGTQLLASVGVLIAAARD